MKNVDLLADMIQVKLILQPILIDYIIVVLTV